jgi:peptidyl-prolyl cis-trans isomerase A (cyclophilin A)/peptidyl-prolyl cis-trans isomerase B (cyclophilin B)
MHTRTLILFALCCALGTTAFAADPRVELQTSAGIILLELYPDAAPKTVANFLDYVGAGYYDGSQFHRVIKGFMIQGGGFDRDGHQLSSRPPIVNEAAQSFKAGLKNEVGTIAMARTSDPNSATSQFFINVADNARLNFGGPSGAGYCVFGKVVGGTDVVTKIAESPTGPAAAMGTDVPLQRVVILKASLVPSH